ncbi:adenosine deaminase [Salinifilum aidingensis]
MREEEAPGHGGAVPAGVPLCGAGRYDLPRYDLHCHLDCSVRPDTAVELAAAGGVPVTRPARELVVAPPECGSLPAFLAHVEFAVSVLQSARALRRVARELVHDWHADGVVHGEARFAPQLHTRAGLGMEGAITAVASGLADGAAETGVRTGLLLCCMRDGSPETSRRVAELAVRHRDVVAGIDLAGDERYPGAPHRAAFDAAREAGLGITIHAGEGAGPESVWEALDVLGADRIGHGARSAADAALLRRLHSDGIAVEACPTSNAQTGAVAGFAAHPADRMLADGIAVTVNTDARSTSDTTLGREFARMAEHFGWTAEHERRCQDNARDAAFRSAAAERPC